MDVYNAIMKAADHIERNPGEFNFMFGSVPRSPGCGSTGCALAWIGSFAGREAGSICIDVARDVLQLPKERPPFYTYADHDFAFYQRMDDIPQAGGWREDAGKCAATLRKYAEKFHGKTKEPNKGIPDSVLSIFRSRATDPDKIAA